MREKRAGRRAMMIPVSQLSVILMNLNREACTFPPAKDRDLMTAIHPTLAPSRTLNCWGLGHLTQMPMVTKKYLQQSEIGQSKLSQPPQFEIYMCKICRASIRYCSMTFFCRRWGEAPACQHILNQFQLS